MRRRTAALLLSMIVLTVLQAGQLTAQSPQSSPPPPPESKIKVGDTFPDFTLIDQNRNKVSLHDFKGKKNVAVAFLLFAFSAG